MPVLVVRFIYEQGLVSKLIGWQTNSLWCHTEALSRDGQSWIGAHSCTGVEARKLDWCKPLRERRYALPVTQEQYDRSMTWLESKVGTAYNYADIVGLMLHKRIGVSDHEIICSALMTEFLMQRGWPPLNVQNEFAYLITPETLHLSSELIGKAVYCLG